MKRFKRNFYITTIFVFLSLIIATITLYEISAAFSIAFILFVLVVEAIYLYIFLQFRKGIRQEKNMYKVPTLSGELTINSNDIKSMLVKKGLWERIFDFSTITLQLKSGNVLNFILPDSLVIKMGDYSNLN